MSDMKRQIELYHLTKIYNNQKTSRKALAGVSFTLARAFTAFLGPNGAGKSTMMNIITGNLDATSGKVLWNGKMSCAWGGNFGASLDICRSSRICMTVLQAAVSCCT